MLQTTNEILPGVTWVERSADHASENHDKHGREFEVSGENRGSFRVGNVFSCKSSLYQKLQNIVHVHV